MSQWLGVPECKIRFYVNFTAVKPLFIHILPERWACNNEFYNKLIVKPLDDVRTRTFT